jgi:plastocyanin
LAALLGLATAMLPAIASSETSPTVEAVNQPGGIYTEEKHAWSPAQATVMAGGVVTFSNPGTVPHGVEWVGGPAKPTCTSGVPVGTTESASGGKWSGTCTFAQAGTYTYYCTVHHREMTGTITVDGNGTPTATTAPTTPTTTPTTPTTESSGSPLAAGPTLRPIQHGGFVKGSLVIAKAGAGNRLEVDVLAKSASLAKAKHPTRVRVGRFVRGSVSAGALSFSVKLDAKARRALKRHGHLALSVRITLTPFYGESTTVTRSVTERS